MRRILNILILLWLSLNGFAQEDTHIVDSLRSVLLTQEGDERVKTMLELAWEFYDISFDDCIRWGETALKEANELGYKYLEAEANYTIGIQYGYHGDVDLAVQYLKKAYSQYTLIDDSEYIKEFGWKYSSVHYAFESLWNLATYELVLGNIDTAYKVYEKALPLAEQMNDSSACAYIISNLGGIAYKKNQLEKAFQRYDQSKRMFEAIGDERMVVRTDYYMASISLERGQAAEAKSVFMRIIPILERHEDYYALLGVCKDMGTIFGNTFIDYDSAMFYLQKALAYSEMPMRQKESEVLACNERSEVMAEIANIMMRQGDFQGAVAKYEEALQLAEKNAYLNGQMKACIGLGNVYAKMEQAAKSLQCFQRFFALEKASGITSMHSQIYVPLVMDYVRLGMFDEMKKEMESFKEEYDVLARENADVYVQNNGLRFDIENILQQYEAQNNQILALQIQRNHYRMAFFGLLAISIFVVAIWLLRIILLNNRKRSK